MNQRSEAASEMNSAPLDHQADRVPLCQETCHVASSNVFDFITILRATKKVVQHLENMSMACAPAVL